LVAARTFASQTQSKAAATPTPKKTFAPKTKKISVTEPIVSDTQSKALKSLFLQAKEKKQIDTVRSEVDWFFKTLKSPKVAEVFQKARGGQKDRAIALLLSSFKEGKEEETFLKKVKENQLSGKDHKQGSLLSFKEIELAVKKPATPVKGVTYLTSKLHEISQNLILQATASQWVSRWPLFQDKLEKWVRYEKKELTAKVITAQPLTEDQAKKVLAKIKPLVAADHTLNLQRKIDPSLLGGLIIDVGGYVQDLSLKNQIASIDQNVFKARN